MTFRAAAHMAVRYLARSAMGILMQINISLSADMLIQEYIFDRCGMRTLDYRYHAAPDVSTLTLRAPARPRFTGRLAFTSR